MYIESLLFKEKNNNLKDKGGVYIHTLEEYRNQQLEKLLK